MTELVVLISSSCGLSAVAKMIRVLQSEVFGIQVFYAKIKNVVNCFAFLSWKEQVSRSKEEFQSIELDNIDAGKSKAVLFLKHINSAL